MTDTATEQVLVPAPKAGRRRGRGEARSYNRERQRSTLLTVLLWIMHRTNIARLLTGREGKIGSKG